MKLPLSITESALIKAKSIYETKGIDPSMGLRIGVKGSGCSGASFYLGFDEKKDSDHVFTIDQLNILIEKKHFLYLIGVKLDFVDNYTQSGFTFVNEV